MLKNVIIALFFGFLFNHIQAQNLTLSNGDFENYSTCPTFYDQSNLANNVSSCLGTVDYNYVNCWTIPWWECAPASGAGGSNGYISHFAQAQGPNLSDLNKEMFVVTMDAPMIPGCTYNVSFDVNRLECPTVGTNFFDYGLHFFNGTSPTVCSGTPSPDPAPDCLIQNAHTIPANNWQTYNFTYVATGPHTDILIGFFNNANTFIPPIIFNDAVRVAFDNISVVAANSLPVTDGVATVCSNAAAFNLEDSLGGSPSAGGIWTPALASGTGVFDPAIDLAGTYTFSNSDCLGNLQTANVVVTVIEMPNTGLDGAVAVCSGAAPINLEGSLGGSPSSGGIWTPALASGTGVFDPAIDLPGTYTYSITNSCGSSSSDVVVTISPNILPGTNGVATICANATSFNLEDSLGGSPSAGGIWIPALASGTGWFDPTIDLAGTYTYTIIDCLGDLQTANVVVTIIALPNTGTDAVATVCANATPINLTDSLGGSPSVGGVWTPALASGTGVFDPAIDLAGTYTYSITNFCGTSSNDVVVTVDLCDPPIASFSASDDEICEGDCVTFTDQSVEGDSWEWTFEGGTPSSFSGQDPGTVCFNEQGIHTITQVVSNGTSSSSYSSLIEVHNTPELNLGPDLTIELGEGAILNEFGQSGIYNWSPSDWLDCSTCVSPVTTPEENLTYTANFEDINGCETSADITVFVYNEGTLYVPNVFTPNGDLTNDFFNAKGTSVVNFELLIFNRWGELLFSTNSLENSWDGKFQGKDVPSGTYIYTIKYTSTGRNGLIKDGKIGHVNLLR